jgi:hypothetical protein
LAQHNLGEITNIAYKSQHVLLSAPDPAALFEIETIVKFFELKRFGMQRFEIGSCATLVHLAIVSNLLITTLAP